ncbi:DNA/RNA polymerases superfamily protein [Gossypium australe]|uniref:DNA/RNA polymerases superfamily protein n=1 Tax=Gossypium australe TaxID=47621 RepID=A0A5B6UZ17_9ROSI|nr:DNA/RNA polymerases superfamily protein [Gossypium australe]
MTQKYLNLRQHSWLELLKDYDLVIDYHPGKANIVTDALSQKSLFTLRTMNASLTLECDGSILVELIVKSPSMKCEISKFVSICLICQQVKAEDQVLSGLLQPVMIPEWKLECVNMNFFRVVVDSQKKRFVLEVVRLHGVPLSIISDHDPRFTSRFWGKLHEALGYRLNFSTTFHPQMDGQSE